MILQLLKKILFGEPRKSRGGSGSSLDRELVRKSWRHIEELMTLGKPSNFKTAVMEADKLLDYVLKGKGYRGQMMGDRMKAIPRSEYERDFFDAMWSAHKLRNHIAHSMDYEVQFFEARDAIKNFKRVMQDLKVL
ncbi:MAG: hypothetical protein WC045_01150 [Patescibacteria group bacterium]